MKNLIIAIALTIATGATISLNSCSKASSEDDSVSAKDNATISNGLDVTSDDAAAVAGQSNLKALGLYQVLCGASIVDSANGGPGWKFTITYDGSSICKGAIRSGTVTLALTSGTHWSDQNAQLTLTITNLVIKDAVTGGSYTVNGTHTITNETGGLAWMVAAGLAPNSTVTHRNQSSNMNITFPNGSTRQWNVDRSRSWTSSGSGIAQLITVSVFSQNTTNPNEDVWGTNRYGTAFTNSITQTISANSNLSCPFKPYTGTMVHHVANRTVTVLFGTDNVGIQDGSPTMCGAGFYITYTHNNKTAYAFVPYW